MTLVRWLRYQAFLWPKRRMLAVMHLHQVWPAGARAVIRLHDFVASGNAPQVPGPLGKRPADDARRAHIP